MTTSPITTGRGAYGHAPLESAVSRTRALAACVLLIGCAAEPSRTEAEPAVADVISLLEKPFTGPEVTAFTRDGDRCSVDGNGAIVCPLLGVRLRLDGNDRIRSVDAHPNVLGDYLRPYVGPLPHGIDRSDRRQTLIGKLGNPDESGDDWDRFTVDGRWVFIEYFPSVSPKAGLISQVQVSRPR